jgi:hypothetical protein
MVSGYLFLSISVVYTVEFLQHSSSLSRIHLVARVFKITYAYFVKGQVFLEELE